MSWRGKYWLACGGFAACVIVPITLGLLCQDFVYSVAWLPFNMAVGYTCGRLMALALNQRDREAKEAA